MTEENTMEETKDTNDAGVSVTVDADALDSEEETLPDVGADNVEPPVQDELEVLKARADKIGITYHPNIGVAKLREKIQLHLRSDTKVTEVTVEAGAPNTDVAPKVDQAADYSPEVIAAGYAQAQQAPKLTQAQSRNQSIKEASRLVRVRIACMNPNKRDWPGEVFTVSNSVVGTFKKLVPFNNDAGWHVPSIILQAIRERKCQVFVTATDENGRKRKVARLINEFAVEVLPPLTQVELKELAQRQAMANGH